MKKTLLFAAIAFLSLNEVCAQDAKEHGGKTVQSIVLKNDYTLKTQTAPNNSFSYVLIKNNVVVFNSAESNVLPAIFTSESAAIDAGKNKVAEIEKNNAQKNSSKNN